MAMKVWRNRDRYGATNMDLFFAGIILGIVTLCVVLSMVFG